MQTQNGKRFKYNFDYILRPMKDGRPAGAPLVVEIMTCSTSGGNKSKGTDIQTAFCKAVLGEQHAAPGVNLRQVWARMASQLIVKSAAAKKWGGSAVWIIQDALANYISDTTGLDLGRLRASELNEVNLLAFQYGENDAAEGLRELRESTLYAGPIDSNGDGNPCFLDIIKPSFVPDFQLLESILESREYDVLVR